MRICPKNENIIITDLKYFITVILEYSEHYTIEQNKTK